MTTLDADRATVSTADKLLLLLAMTVYAGAVSVFTMISLVAMMRETGIRVADVEPSLIVTTFIWIVFYAVCFAALAGALDLLTRRRPQPLNALNFGLVGSATAELLREPLLLGAMQLLILAQ